MAVKNKRDLMDHFKTIDVNGDGALDEEELNTFYADRNKSDKKKRK